MAALNESKTKTNKSKRGKRARQSSGDRSQMRKCSECGSRTRWLSVDALCWDCTVKAAKNKMPIFIETSEEEQEGTDANSNILNEY